MFVVLSVSAVGTLCRRDLGLAFVSRSGLLGGGLIWPRFWIPPDDPAISFSLDALPLLTSPARGWRFLERWTQLYFLGAIFSWVLLFIFLGKL